MNPRRWKKLLECPGCGEHRTNKAFNKGPSSSSRRILTHYINGKRCPGSGMIIHLGLTNRHLNFKKEAEVNG